MIHTNRCKNCGLTKEQHEPIETSDWEDSGLAALDAHKEELYDFVIEVSQAHPDGNPISLIKKAQSILNQIEKEK